MKTLKTIKIELRPFREYKLCPNCKSQRMRYETLTVSENGSNSFAHKCLNCGHYEDLEDRYPRIVFEEIGYNNAG